MGADTVRSVNHTVRLDICPSAQHGFVGQAWSGPGVGIRPTRHPLRLSRHVPANGWLAVNVDGYQVSRQRGFRSRQITLVTTWRDAGRYPKDDLAELSFTRWEAKTH